MRNDFIDMHKGLPEIYILINQWQTQTEDQTDVICAFKSEEEAIEWLKDQYKDDLDWIMDMCNCNEKDLDDNCIEHHISRVSKDVFSATSYIETVYLH